MTKYQLLYEYSQTTINQTQCYWDKFCAASVCAGTASKKNLYQ